MKTNTQPKNTFYDYQQKDIETIFDQMESSAAPKLLYQLPTGAGKTVVFSEIARRFIAHFGKTVIILTHRKELCTQTSTTLKKLE